MVINSLDKITSLIDVTISLFVKIVLAYLSREYNVIAVDWETLTKYPCYLTSLSHTKLVSQCTAQVRILQIFRQGN